MRNYSSKLGVPKSELIQLDHVYEFEKQLAIRMEERSERDPEKNYHVTSLNNLSTICPIMHWELLVTEVLKPVNLTISPDDPIAFSDWDFFKNRCRLYEEYLSNDTGIKCVSLLEISHNSPCCHLLN
ncbi:unnamed protein product [Dicrocoelium dendriticum]|nr:unnamed protein product [Dicrocoelium dendriticum]